MKKKKYSRLGALALAFALVGNSLPVNVMTTKAAVQDYQAEASVAQDYQLDTAGAGDYGLMDDIQGSSILHCWNWSYKTIEEHMELIAECGYTAVQTSPAQQPKDYTYEGNVCSEVGYPGLSSSGNWWKMYQPVTFNVCDNGQTWLGTKAELESMCATAEKYGVKVIVDIVANHLGNISGWQNSMTDISPQVGEYWCEDMMTDPTYWHINDLQIWMSDGREDVTQGTMGMPDLNTGDKRVQKFVYEYLDELIDCGVDGFRFDAAKHIETDEDDPAFASDFWNTVLGEARSHYSKKTGGNLYVYGEILNRIDGLDFSAYTKNMSITDNSAGNNLLNSVRYGQIGGLGSCFPIADSESVVWCESHDTYMGEGSRYATDTSVVQTWGMVGSKKDVASLFFARPYYSKDTLIDDTNGAERPNMGDDLEPAIMGKCETYVWASKEVAAVNHFNNYYHNETSEQGNEDTIGYCRRGDGMVIINLAGPGAVSLQAHGLPTGTYKDEVSGTTFTCDGTTVSGTIGGDYGIAVLYKGARQNPSTTYPVDLRSNKDDGSEYCTDKLKLKLTARYADTATYSCSTGEKGSFKDQDVVYVGEGLAAGEKITVTLTGTNTRGTYTKSFTYTKKDLDMDSCIFFTTSKNWVRANAYIYHAVGKETDKILSGWPGNAMFEYAEDEEGHTIYALEVPELDTYNSVIFNNNVSELGESIGEYGQLFDADTGKWSDYSTPDPNGIKISTDLQPCEIRGEKKVTFTVENADDATYSVDGAAPVSFKGTVTLTLGTGKEEGDSTTVNIEATKDGKTKTKSFTYTIGEDLPMLAISEDSKCFTKEFDVTISADNVTEATYQLGDESPKAFEGSKTLTIGENANAGELISLIVSGTGRNGKTVMISRGYVKTGVMVSNDIFFKNTDSWADVCAYMWNDASGEENAAWPGLKMEAAEDGIYKIEVPEDKFDHIIFNNGGNGKQTDDLELPSAGKLYNAGKWEDYVSGTKPAITASLASGSITKATEVTFTVKDGETCTYKLNDGNETEFTGSVTLKVGDGLSKGQADNVIIKALNGETAAVKSFTYTFTTQTQECTHDKTEVRNKKDATCTEAGYTGDTVCTNCGKVTVKGTVIPAKGHNWSSGVCTVCGTNQPIDCNHSNTTIRGAKDATCTETGYTGDTVCTDCNEETVKGTVIPAKGHNWSSGVCTVCGTNQPVDCKHNNTTVRGAKDATCTEAGYTGDTVCTDCGEETVKGTVIPAKGHTWSSGVCTECGAKHDDISINVTVVDADIVYDGKAKTPQIIVKAGKKLLTKNVDYTISYKNNINAGEASAVVTCMGDYTGTIEKTFTIAKATGPLSGIPGTEKIAPKSAEKVSDIELPSGWKWSEEDADKKLETGVPVTATAVYEEADKNNFETVSVSVKITKSDCEHSIDKIKLNNEKAATCTEKGYTGDKYCEDCQLTIETGTETKALGHSWDEGSITKEPTATETGEMTYKCSRCTETKTEEIPAVCRHLSLEVKNEKAATCTEKGYTGDSFCTVCGEEVEKGNDIPAVGHSWDSGKVTKEATATEKGIMTYTCTKCSNTRTEEIPATGDNENINNINYIPVITVPDNVEKGDSVEDTTTNSVYIVTSDGSTSKTVKYIVAGSEKDTLVVPNAISINGEVYKVTAVAGDAFKGNATVKKIIVGDNVKTIGTNAFSNCKNLSEVIIGKNVTTISANAFSNCTKLTKVTFGKNVTTIGKNAFGGCTKLSTVTLPSKLSKIAEKAFYKCTNLKSIMIPAKVKTIGKNAFSNCKNLSKVTIGNNVTTIGTNAFSSCTKLTKVTFGKNVTTIGKNAFGGCTKLSIATLPSKLSKIEEKAFYKCRSLKSITIPAKVKTIGKNAFNGCKNLKSIKIKTTKLTKKNVGSNAFKGIYSKATITVPKSKLKSYTSILKARGVSSKAKIRK
ncbi:MAG: leucine-rich repeat protein [Lachnospiraceae bacterium]|nr:leucine-rich repeat protein [Lachnospiraceae bacterium]